jgi:hydrogenase expression/formation protein HypC
MCLAIPGKIIDIESNNARVDFNGVIKKVSIELMSNINIGDYVLVHAGVAIEKVKNEDAAEIIELLKVTNQLG